MEGRRSSASHPLGKINQVANGEQYPTLPSSPSYSSFTSYTESDDILNSTVYAYVERTKDNEEISSETEPFLNKEDDDNIIIHSFKHTTSVLHEADLEINNPPRKIELHEEREKAIYYIHKLASNKAFNIIMILLIGSILGLTIYYVYFYSNKQEIIGTNSFIGLNVGLSLATSPLLKRQAGEILISLKLLDRNVHEFDLRHVGLYVVTYEYI